MHSRIKDSLCLAFAVLMLAQVVNVHRLFLILVERTMHEINQNSCNHPDNHLDCQNLDNRYHRCLLRDQNRKHLIGGRQIDGNQGSKRDHSACIEIGSCGREAALREDSEQSTYDRTKVSGFLYHMVCFIACLMLEILNEKIGDKEKGKQLERIHQRIRGNIK